MAASGHGDDDLRRRARRAVALTSAPFAVGSVSVRVPIDPTHALPVLMPALRYSSLSRVPLRVSGRSSTPPSESGRETEPDIS